MLKLKNISPSRIKTFLDCLYKYWLTYHTDEELKSNWGAAHGTLIHDILENLSNENDTDWMDRLYRGYNGTLETLDRHGEPEVMESPLVWAKPVDFQEKRPYCDTCPYAVNGECSISKEPLDNLTGCPRALFDGSINMLNRVIVDYQSKWLNILRDANGVPVGTEYKYEVALPGRPDVPMIGIMDLVIEEDPETIHVIDYKAGKHTQNFQECCDDIQVKMYALACEREFVWDVNDKGYRYKNVILTFDYFRASPITVAFSPEENAKTERFVVDMINKIESTDWIRRVVRSDHEMDTKTRFGQVGFKCKYLCDTAVCKRTWDKPFRTGDSDED